jgi:hypothetical protein
MDSLVNFGRAILSVNYDDSATSIVLSAQQFAKLPQAAPYNLVWWNHTDFPSPEDDSAVEIVRVTALNAGTYTLTITRAQEGTAAVVHNLSGKEYWLMNGLTKAVMDGIQSAIDANAAKTWFELDVNSDLEPATVYQSGTNLEVDANGDVMPVA